MTEITVEFLNRRTATAAARQEAERRGIDPEFVLDSKKVGTELGALNPDEPGFAARIRDIVGARAAQLENTAASTASTEASGALQQTREQPRQWTLEDVKAASPAETLAAADAGLLRDMGVGPSKRRR